MPLRYAEPGHVGLGRALEQDCIDSALELVTLPQHGITLRLIGAMIATTAACCHATPGYKATARQFLAEVGPQLPAAQICPNPSISLHCIEAIPHFSHRFSKSRTFLRFSG